MSEYEAHGITKRMRDCLARAERARLAGDRRAYRRLIEEFLFLGQATRSLIGSFIGDDMGDLMLPRVLVVHDDEGVVQMMRECFIVNGEAFHLERLLHQCVHSALDALDERRPHLIIIPSSLRIADGLGAMHAIRKHAHGRALPVLVLSDNVHGSDAMLALAAGANCYMPMPDAVSDYPSLAEKMRELLATSELGRKQA